MIHAAPCPTAPTALQPQRIAATSVAIAVHRAAVALLLAPLANPGTPVPANERIQVQWQQAQPLVPTPPPPLEPVRATHTPPRPHRTRHRCHTALRCLSTPWMRPWWPLPYWP